MLHARFSIQFQQTFSGDPGCSSCVVCEFDQVFSTCSVLLATRCENLVINQPRNILQNVKNRDTPLNHESEENVEFHKILGEKNVH